MKKYIIILVIAMVSMLTINVNAQSYEFQSTSTMISSGSSLSSESGFQSADVYYTTTVQHHGVGRKALDVGGGDEDDEEENPGEWGEDPTDINDPLPIGDGLWVLLAMAAGYAAIVAGRRKRA